MNALTPVFRKSLAFLGFEEEPTLNQIRCIASICYALGPHLERLFLDVFLRPIDYTSPLNSDLSVSLRSAVRGMSKLSVFCNSRVLPWQFEPSPWASAETMKRIATFRTNLHHRLVNTMDAFKALETFYAAFPLVTGTQVTGTPLQRMFHYMKDQFKSLTVILPADRMCIYSVGMRKLLEEVMDSDDVRNLASVRRELLQVMEVPDTSDQPHLWDTAALQRDWFVKAVADGSLWSATTTPWDEFQPKRRRSL